MTKFNMTKGMLTAFAFLSAVTLFAQGVCTQFTYYYADITYPNGGELTTIYDVQLTDSNAVMTPVIEGIEFGVHIAFHNENGLIYAVNDDTGEISILDPMTGELLSTRAVDQSVGHVTTAAFNAENILLIGSHNGNIYQVDDLMADPIELSIYSSGNDISGGDITFGGDQNLYLASKPQGKFYEVIAGFANPVLGNVNGNVTGIATLEDGSGVLVASRNNGQFLTYNLDGGVTEMAAYDATLFGEPFTLGNGDMASGCSESSSSIEGCADFRTYYIHDAQGGGPDLLYAVDFNAMGGASLVELAEIAGGSHLGLGADGLLYLVKYSSGMLTTFDPETLLETNQVQITLNGNNIGNIPAVVVGDDGFVYVGSNNDVIYKVDPLSGNAEVEGEADVNGGDLIFVDGVLWLANRAQGRFYEVNGNGQFDIAAEEINGVSVLPDGNLLVANGNLNGLFEVYEPGTGIATGETFQTGLVLYNGDLASRCFDGNQGSDCTNFQLFLSANADQGGNIYRVSLGDGVASLELLLEGLSNPHIAYDESNGLLYVVKGNGKVAIYDPVSDVLSTFSDIATDSMSINQTYAAVVTNDGKLLVGSANQNYVYEVNPATGAATNPVSVPVSGGDIIQTLDGNIWVVNRGQNTFYNITDGVSQFTIDELTQMYGAAVMETGLILVGNAGTQLRVVDPASAGVTETVYELGMSITAGDLAGGCADANAVVVPEPGTCNASEVFEYIQGVRSNGGALETNRTDATQALGAPEGIDQLVFVTLGYGGSIELGFDGAVANLDGDDIQIIETSYGNPGCAAYPEYADVYVSQNGVDFLFAETVCKSDNSVDISSAGDLDYITVVKIVNNDSLTTTPDAYDLDGVIAIHNCDSAAQGEDTENEPVQIAHTPSTVLSTYPNPTEGQATVEIAAAHTERAVVEVFDMNGRSVETILNQDVQAGNTYRLDFEGASLPNGIYMVKFVTESETVIEKIMIAR